MVHAEQHLVDGLMLSWFDLSATAWNSPPCCQTGTAVTSGCHGEARALCSFSFPDSASSHLSSISLKSALIPLFSPDL